MNYSSKLLFKSFWYQVAIWSFGYFLWRISSSEHSSGLLLSVTDGASIFMPITAYHFSIVLRR